MTLPALPNQIQRLAHQHRVFIAIVTLLTCFWIWGANWVPFHPDESSWLYMSRDFELWITQPGSLLWQAGTSGDLDQNYREINPPLTKYILGLGRWLSGSVAPGVDWNWSDTWQGNLLTGGMPPARTLLAGRLAIVLLLPLTLSLTYLCAIQLGSKIAGLSAALFLGLHPLVLLHARRAMAEGPMLFGIALAIYGILRGDKRPWLASLGVALALNAKQSTLPLLVVGLLGVLWTVAEEENRWRAAISRAGLYIATLAGVTLLLNPIYWRQPVKVFQTAWQARTTFTQQVTSSIKSHDPGQVIESKAQRTAIILVNLYLRPPQFYEIGNYQQETAPAEQRYLSVNAHSWGQGYIGGGIALTLTLLGAALAIIRLRHASPPLRRKLVLLFLLTGLQAAGLIIAVPLTFQRYAIPLLPLISLWIGLALAELWRAGSIAWRARPSKDINRKPAHNQS